MKDSERRKRVNSKFSPEGKRVDWIQVYNSLVPRNFAGRFHAICANLRCLCVVFFALWRDCGKVDVWILDQVPIPIFVLKIFAQRTIFYCHFPDCLLAPHNTTLQRLYRTPIDYVEEHCTGMADCIVVNSYFTAEVFSRTFKRLYRKGISPEVVYPTASLTELEFTHDVDATFRTFPGKSLIFQERKIFLSINRFDSNKNLRLAILAFHKFIQQNRNDATYMLILAGGFDSRLQDNVQVLRELRRLKDDLELSDSVLFLPSINNHQKQVLLHHSLCVLYTPNEEHFGIVPLEAMQYHKPVVACNSGGPKETVIHGVTGFLCENTPESFACAMSKLARVSGLAERMGNAAQLNFGQKFDVVAFRRRVREVLSNTAESNCEPQIRSSVPLFWYLWIFLSSALLLAIFICVSVYHHSVHFFER